MGSRRAVRRRHGAQAADDYLAPFAEKLRQYEEREKADPVPPLDEAPERGVPTSIVKIIRIAALLGALAACPAAFAQPIDYSLALFDGGVPVTGGDVVVALVVSADLWTDAKEPFVVRLALPPGLVPTAVCSGETTFDAAARIFTWTDRLDNPGLAQKSCPVLLRIDSATVPGTAYNVLASLTTSAPDRDPSNNIVARVLTVLPASDLRVTSSADPRMIKPGETLTYTFAVTNHGPQDAYDVVFDVELSPHLSVVSYEQTGGPSARVGVPTVIGHLRIGETATFRLVREDGFPVRDDPEPRHRADHERRPGPAQQ